MPEPLSTATTPKRDASWRAAASLSACGTLGGLGSQLGSATNGNTQQILSNLDKINAAAAQHCTGAAHIAWNPPFPPTGSMNLDCYIQPPGSVMMGQGGAFGGGGSTVVIPLSQFNSLMAAAGAASAATPAPAAPPVTPK